MRKAQEKVRAFHKKHGIPCDLRLENQESSEVVDDFLRDQGRQMVLVAKGMLDKAKDVARNHGDYRLLRAHLLMEELGELLVALGERDLIEVADGLGDLGYVALGTAETYGLPLGDVFDEVHRSNMTKQASTDQRVSVKGPNYVPPDIAGVLRLPREQEVTP